MIGDVVGNVSKKICCICLNDIVGNRGEITDCAHCFCYQCIEEWCRNNLTCPLDRKEISIITIYDDDNNFRDSINIQTIYQPQCDTNSNNFDSISLDIDFDIGQFYNFWRSRHLINSSLLFNQIESVERRQKSPLRKLKQWWQKRRYGN